MKTTAQAAELLEEIRRLMELKGENPFKSRAYVNAARALETLTEPLERLVAENRLSDVKGLGDAIQKKLCELVTTGRLGYHEELKAAFPPGLFARSSSNRPVRCPSICTYGFSAAAINRRVISASLCENA